MHYNQYITTEKEVGEQDAFSYSVEFGWLVEYDYTKNIIDEITSPVDEFSLLKDPMLDSITWGKETYHYKDLSEFDKKFFQEFSPGEEYCLEKIKENHENY